MSGVFLLHLIEIPYLRNGLAHFRQRMILTTRAKPHVCLPGTQSENRSLQSHRRACEVCRGQIRAERQLQGGSYTPTVLSGCLRPRSTRRGQPYACGLRRLWSSCTAPFQHGFDFDRLRKLGDEIGAIGFQIEYPGGKHEAWRVSLESCADENGQVRYVARSFLLEMQKMKKKDP
jgi:hypothetical protein